jgi:hypothetical protein
VDPSAWVPKQIIGLVGWNQLLGMQLRLVARAVGSGMVGVGNLGLVVKLAVHIILGHFLNFL